MYRIVPQLYDTLFNVINDEFGPSSSRAYFKTFEKGRHPRRGVDFHPELFPWGYVDIGRLSPRQESGDYYSLGRKDWYKATFSLVVIGFAKDGDISRLSMNIDFTGDATVAMPGVVDISSRITDYLTTDYQTAGSFVTGDNFIIEKWVPDGGEVMGDLVVKRAAPDSEDFDFFRAWHTGLIFDITEQF